MFKTFFDSGKVTSIALDNVNFEVKHTVRKNMKRIVLRIEKRNQIRLGSPKVSKKTIQDFLNDQKEWIITTNCSLCLPYARGSVLHYLANEYIIEHHKGALKIDGETVYINPTDSKNVCDRFYKLKSREYLPSRVDYWKNIMALEHNGLKFRVTKRRWGSCNSKGVITINPYVMKLSHEMIDYIIVHELAHLVHLNHSNKFYTLIEEFIPEYAHIQNKINALSKRIVN